LAQATAPRFYPDDPLRQEPAPVPVANLQARALSDVLERAGNAFSTKGERHPATGVYPARGVNSMGDVMDGDWYVNRHGTRRMSIAELQRGSGSDLPPSTRTPWQVLVVRAFGTNPGLLVADAKNDLYLLRFDPPGYQGLATGAEMVTSRFLFALGYHVPESYLVQFERSGLVIHPEGQAISSSGRTRAVNTDDLETFLRRLQVPKNRPYRAVALRLHERRQALLGPFRMWGTRSDDPNDTVPHEHRRDLRGLFVFAAWLNHSDAGALRTQDTLTEADGPQHVRHFLFDFMQSLGSGRQDGPKVAWEGNENEIPKGGAIRRNMASLGIVAPAWMKAKLPGLPEVGAFEAASFDPGTWTTIQPLPPFENRLPDDTFWAARKVMAFTDDEIRAIVQTGQYSKPAEDWITATLIERRNRIGRAFFAQVLPLDGFRMTGTGLEFDDLSARHGFTPARTFSIDWYGFDNAADTLLAKLGTGPASPPGALAVGVGAYVAARVYGDDEAMHVTVFLRRRTDGFDVVGLDRAWPGRRIARPAPPARPNDRVFSDLSAQQQALFATYITGFNQARGRSYSPEQGFDQLTLSEQTTFYGITHALSRTMLTDAKGGSLGSALDLVESIERIAGQYAGRGGDEQFRLYVKLKPTARELLEKSREFFRDEENTIYHTGYPHSFRLAGKEPNLQMSLAEDGMRADIDVDYRSSRSPQALFNGHLTSSNSDIRVGENTDRHGARWGGIVAWWREAFGGLPGAQPAQTDVLNLDRPDLPPTPLPPDRPAGARLDRVEDAAQEFLTDWLVRRQYGQALEALSPRAYACVHLGDDARSSGLDAAAARRELQKIMQYASDRLGTQTNLTNAITTVTPRDPKRVIVSHPFQQEFLLTPLAENEARSYLCDRGATPAPVGAEYVGVVFQFRQAGGGTFGLLWSREEGQWKLISYRLLAQ
jgi:hypothetical protein